MSTPSRHVRRSHYRVTPATRAQYRGDDAETRPEIPVERDQQKSERDGQAQQAQRHVTVNSAPPQDVADAPTIVLTPDQIAQLTHATPVKDRFKPEISDGYRYASPSGEPPAIFGLDLTARPHPSALNEPHAVIAREARPEPAEPSSGEIPAEPPTILLDVESLRKAPPPAPPMRRPVSSPTERPPDRSSRPSSRPFAPPSRPLTLPSEPRPAPPERSDASWPRVPRPIAVGPHVPGAQVTDPDGDFARLRSERLSHKLPPPDNEPHEIALTGKLRQFWHTIKPGLDRVLGRSHRAGVRGYRETNFHTSSSLPAVQLRPTDSDATPVITRLSQTAKQIGVQAREAALPALVQFHVRAEQAAQRLVDRIDARLGSTPPMQHVLLGPGRMVIAFAPGISIRNAQTIIAATHARALRRVVGYNAYLVLVPPGREARYAERFHNYREVTGVHFGPPHQASGV